MIYSYKRREDKNGTFSAQWLKVICETKGWMSNISWFLKLKRIFQFLTFLKSKWILHYANHEINSFIFVFIKERKKKPYFKIAKHLQILIFFSVIFSSCRFFSQISDGTIFSSPSVCDSSTTANITRLLLLVSKALTRSINSLLSQRRRWHLRRKM